MASAVAASASAASATASPSAYAVAANHPAVLRDDEGGVPRSLRLLAALVESESRRCAAAASRSADSDLVRAFRGSAGATASRPAEDSDPVVAFRRVAGTTPSPTPTLPIREFLERIHRFVRLQDVRHVVEIQATCYVLAGIYLSRFLRSSAAREARIKVDPSTAHRLVSAALFVGAKFGADNTLPKRWTTVFEFSSDGAIRAREMAGLERQFLRAVNYRLFVTGECFDWFCRILEGGPPAEHGTCSARKRTASVAAGDEREDGDERRRVRPCLPPPPPPAVVSN